MIYHIYWGTSGNSGLYLHEIYQVLKNNGYRQKAFVNYYFPFDYGEKLFFKRGDLANGSAKGKVRKIFQLLEVLKGYFIILLFSIIDRPKLINYSHAGQSYFFVPLFLRLLKTISGSKLMITCHDVAPHGGWISEMKYRKQIFHIADFLLVHTDDSIKELVDMFGVKKEKIVTHLFPIMDLTLLPKKTRVNPFSKTDFLFIGNLRKDKGVEFLLNVWPQFHRVCPTAKLRICGRKLPNVNFDQVFLEKCNVEFNLNFVSDEDYFDYVKSARYILFPYISGTNSGVISTVLSLGADVITSDIPMFSENPLINSEDIFITEDEESFIKKLVEKYKENNKRSNNKLIQYREAFNQGIITVYSSILTK